MNPEIKTQWVTALRSGEYKQGSAALKDTEDRYCCLGVLCDLAVKAGVISDSVVDISISGREKHFFSGASEYLPEAVQEWSGLFDENPVVTRDSELEETTNALSTLNDSLNYDFNGIADLIEEQL